MEEEALGDMAEASRALRCAAHGGGRRERCPVAAQPCDSAQRSQSLGEVWDTYRSAGDGGEGGDGE